MISVGNLRQELPREQTPASEFLNITSRLCGPEQFYFQVAVSEEHMTKNYVYWLHLRTYTHGFSSTSGPATLYLDVTCASWSTGVFPQSTTLPSCQWLSSDIETSTCQVVSKTVTITLGGGGSNPSFSTIQAQQFAGTIWNLFLGDSSDIRPFGTAIFNGADFDIERGSTDYFAAMVTQLRSSHMNGALIFKQDNWAKTASPNLNIRIFMGLAATPAATMTFFRGSETTA